MDNHKKKTKSREKEIKTTKNPFSISQIQIPFLSINEKNTSPKGRKPVKDGRGSLKSYTPNPNPPRSTRRIDSRPPMLFLFFP